MLLENRLAQIQEKIRAALLRSGRSESAARIVAVTKTLSADVIRAAYNLGLRDFAENYMQEFLLKKNALADLDIQWHFIGHLQSKKIKQAANMFCIIHSIDRLKAAVILNEATEQSQDVLLQVNLVGEKSKSGCAIEELDDLIFQIRELKKLKLRGLMFMPPLELSPEEQRNYFRQAHKLKDKHSLVELSMGTSHDFEVAIEEGATLVRLGTVLFGERK